VREGKSEGGKEWGLRGEVREGRSEVWEWVGREGGDREGVRGRREE